MRNRSCVSRSVAIVIALAAGALIGLQPASNSALSHHVGDLGAAFVSVAISAAIIAALLLLVGHPGQLAGLRGFRPEHAVGGIGGGVIVTVGLIVVRPLGAGAVIALFVASQLIMAVIADRFGWFGVHHVAIGPARLIGLVLVVGGTALVTSR